MCVLTGKDRVKEMESNTLDEAMQEAVASVDTSNLTEQADLHHNDILPPINTEAKVTRCFNCYLTSQTPELSFILLSFSHNYLF